MPLHEYSDTPSDAGQGSDIARELVIPPAGRVKVVLKSETEMDDNTLPEMLELEVDHMTTIGCLRQSARDWMKLYLGGFWPEEAFSTTRISVVHNGAACLNDHTKLYELAICHEDEPPQFSIEVVRDWRIH